MLDSLSKRQKEKKLNQIDERVKKGFALIDHKEFKQATIELSIAFEESFGEIKETLENKFNEFLSKDHHEGIRAVGLVVLKFRANDFNLYNTLGNSSRRLGDFKQANHFYKQALKANNAFLTAFHNLAASMANVDKYDSEVAETLNRFENDQDFFLPDYKNELIPDEKASFEDTCLILRQAIKENWRNKSITEGKQILQSDIFNLGLYALSQKNPEIALENFEKLKNQDSGIKYLDMLVVLAKTLKDNNIKFATESLVGLLKEQSDDRFLTGNLGILYRKAGNSLLSVRYLLACSDLLDKFEGFFSGDALVKAARQKLEDKDYVGALKLYKIASQESPSLETWENLANLNFRENNIPGAIEAYNKVLALNPKSDQARQKLHLIYNQFKQKSEFLLKKKKFQQAIVIMERALLIERSPDFMDKAAKTYKILKDFDKAEVLLEESRGLREKQEKEEQEKVRESYLIKGKEYSKRKEFTLAIENLEEASKIRLDKDVFMYLAHIYKGLKRTRALQNLINRWNQKSQSSPEAEDEQES
jgi:tetratricopeptide (TPR) repeat protein